MNSVRTVRVARIFGTVASFRAVASPRGLDSAEAAADRVLEDLAAVDLLCSPFRPGSEVSRIDRGELRLADAHPSVQEVARLCEDFRIRSAGRFDAAWQGGFDPTGLVKGWSVERAAAAHLAPLVAAGSGIDAVGVTVGGDMRLYTSDDSAFAWEVGIVSPTDARSVAATVPVRSGAVATSGTAERGAHIVDPTTGRTVVGPISATVLAPTLIEADAWATVAAVAGFDDLGWITAAPSTTGVLLDATGAARRWTSGVEVSVSVHAA